MSVLVISGLKHFLSFSSIGIIWPSIMWLTVIHTIWFYFKVLKRPSILQRPCQKCSVYTGGFDNAIIMIFFHITIDKKL